MPRLIRTGETGTADRNGQNTHERFIARARLAIIEDNKVCSVSVASVVSLTRQEGGIEKATKLPMSPKGKKTKRAVWYSA